MYCLCNHLTVTFKRQQNSHANNMISQHAPILVLITYLSLECQVTQEAHSHNGPPPPLPLLSTLYMKMDLMLLRASCAGWWIYGDCPFRIQNGPCEDSQSLNLPHAALPLCHSPWPLTSQAEFALSSDETSETTAETEKQRHRLMQQLMEVNLILWHLSMCITYWGNDLLALLGHNIDFIHHLATCSNMLIKAKLLQLNGSTLSLVVPSIKHQ